MRTILLALLLAAAPALAADVANPPPQFAEVKKQALEGLEKAGAHGCVVEYAGPVPEMTGFGGVQGTPHVVLVKCSDLRQECLFVMHPTEPVIAGPVECTPNPDYYVPQQRM